MVILLFLLKIEVKVFWLFSSLYIVLIKWVIIWEFYDFYVYVIIL